MFEVRIATKYIFSILISMTDWDFQIYLDKVCNVLTTWKLVFLLQILLTIHDDHCSSLGSLLVVWFWEVGELLEIHPDTHWHTDTQHSAGDQSQTITNQPFATVCRRNNIQWRVQCMMHVCLSSDILTR